MATIEENVKAKNTVKNAEKHAKNRPNSPIMGAIFPIMTCMIAVDLVILVVMEAVVVIRRQGGGRGGGDGGGGARFPYLAGEDGGEERVP